MDTILNNYKNLLEIEFHILKEKNMYVYEEEKKVIIKQTTNDKYTIDYNSFKNRRTKELLKKDELKKYKASLNDNDYTINDFMNSDIIKYETSDVVINKVNIDEMNYEQKKEKLDDYLSRKNIYLDNDEYDKLQNILKDINIKLCDYIQTSSMFGDITKVYFITKIKESNIYIIDLSINKSSKSSSSKHTKKKIIFKSMN